MRNNRVDGFVLAPFAHSVTLPHSTKATFRFGLWPHQP